MNTRATGVRLLTIIGGLGVLVGGFDPMEGSIAVAAGTVMLAIAARLGEAEWRVRRVRYALCAATAFGVGALWVISSRGGLGGATGRSMAWLGLVFPMVVGWSLSFWAPGTPRWLTWAGVAGGAWYLVLPALVAWMGRHNPNVSWPLLVGLALVGGATIGGCGWRLWQPRQPDLRR